MKRILCALCLLLAFIVTGCGGEKKAEKKEEAVIMVGGYLTGGKFDPTIGWGLWAADIFHSHILTVGKDNTLVYDLATSDSVSPDGMTYTYGIRKDAKFADGVQLTAKDIVFTFEKTKEAASAVDLTMLDRVEAVDDYTVKFYLKRPWSSFPHLLSRLGIIPAHAYGENYGSKPMGSGPWQVADFQKDQQVIMVPNEHYYGAKPKLKKVTALKMDEDAALAGAQSGQLDVVYINPEFKNQTVKGMELKVIDTIDFFFINLPTIAEGMEGDMPIGNPVTKDIAVRQALNIGINRQTVIDKSISGAGVPLYDFAGLVLNSDIKDSDGKVEEAKKILEAAGWVDSDGDGIREKDGVKAEFTISGRSNDLARYNTVVAVAEEAQKLGIKINAKSMAWPEARKARAVPTCFAGHQNDPLFIYDYMHSSQIGVNTIGNPASYHNPVVDALIDGALRATNPEDADKLWREAEKTASNDYPYLPISNPQIVYFVNNKLNIPAYDKRIERGQGLAIIENMNEWSF